MRRCTELRSSKPFEGHEGADQDTSFSAGIGAREHMCVDPWAGEAVQGESAKGAPTQACRLHGPPARHQYEAGNEDWRKS